MTLTSADDQEQLRALVRQFLADRSPRAAVREWMESEPGYDPAMWTVMAGELGLQGLALPPEHGGSGGGPVELGIVVEELGRALVPVPFLSSIVFGGQALAISGNDAAARRWLPGLADGSLTATLAVSEQGSSWDLDAVRTTAVPEGAGDRWLLRGTKTFVIDGDTAALVLVVASSDAGPGIFAVEAGATGLTRTRLAAVDPTRRLAHVTLLDTPAVRLDPDGDAPEYLRSVLDLALVALAAEQVGGAQACLDMCVQHATTRVQFGRPIGSFQAIKHKCADMLVALEASRSALQHATAVAAEVFGGARDRDDRELSIAAAVAGAYCSQAYVHAAKETIQIHGGIGFTWEHDAHLHLKRAKSTQLLFGAPRQHRARLCNLVGI